ncbi:MAG: TolC family protein [Planctomycetota bacterium]
MRVYLLTFLMCAACVSYESQHVALDEMAAEVDGRSVPPLDFAGAVAYAREHNPELKRLAAEARAAGLDIPSTTLLATANFHQEHARALINLTDVLGMGPRGAAMDVAERRQLAALAALVEAERSNAARIAEVFLVERTLAAMSVPEVSDGLQRFHDAGLASDADRARIEQALRTYAAEKQMISAWRRENLARLNSLLGLGNRAKVELTLPEGDFPALEGADRERLLVRPDLAVALAEYRVADGMFRQAVKEQYPQLLVGGELGFGGGGGPIAGFTLPIGASKRAKAANERREAARLALESALLDAEREAVASAALYQAADLTAQAHAAHFVASTRDYEAALARLDLEPDAFAPTARTAVETMMAAMERREAAVDAARLKVRYAESYGWPAAGEVR